MSTKSTNAWYFGAQFLLKAWSVCNVTQLYVLNDSDYEDKYDKYEQFTTSNKCQLDMSLCAPLLPSVYLCYPKIQLTNNVTKPLLHWGKSPICAQNWTIQSPTVTSEA